MYMHSPCINSEGVENPLYPMELPNPVKALSDDPLAVSTATQRLRLYVLGTIKSKNGDGGIERESDHPSMQRRSPHAFARFFERRLCVLVGWPRLLDHHVRRSQVILI